MLKIENNKLDTILSLLFIIFVLYFLIRDYHNIQSIILKSGALAPLVVVALYSILAPTPISTDPLTIFVSSVYGPLLGALIAFFGNMLAGLVEYKIGASIDQVTKFSSIQDKLPLGLSKLPVSSPAFLVFGRLIPFYGGKIISILAGVYRVPVKTYIWTTVVTTALGSILLAVGGFHLLHLFVR